MTAQNSPISLGNTWELSLYELHRKPHEMVSDNSAIAVSPRSLHSELMCPICLDLMRNTQTTKECLHRFCQECIITALRSGNKECPTCRKKLVSKRSLRPDPNFDKLIAKIYPNREELNAQQEKQVNRRAQPIHRRKRKVETSPSVDGDRESTAGSEEKEVKLDEPEEDSVSPPSRDPGGSASVELQIRPHPCQSNLTEMAIRNLSSSPLCTVSHLLRFIKLHTEPAAMGPENVESLSFNLHVQIGEDFACLSSSTTLKHISKMYWLPGDKLKLYLTAEELS